MADNALVLNDVLCFLANNIRLITLKTLKSTIIMVKHTHIPRQRDCDGQLEHEVDDLLFISHFLMNRKPLNTYLNTCQVRRIICPVGDCIKEIDKN